MRTLAISFAAIAAFAACSPSNARASRCLASIHGERITAANAFDVSGLSCENAVRSAAGYIDSAARINVSLPGTERFTADFFEWHYLWTCRTTELPAREQHLVNGVSFGAYYRCHAVQELGGHRLSMAYMRFKWWLTEERSCPSFPLEDEVSELAVAREVATTRNVRCSEARTWLKAAVEHVQYELEPYRIKREHFTNTNPEGSEPRAEEVLRYEYHYGLYNCTVSPTKLSENGPKWMSCKPAMLGWEGRDYSLAEN